MFEFVKADIPIDKQEKAAFCERLIKFNVSFSQYKTALEAIDEKEAENKRMSPVKRKAEESLDSQRKRNCNDESRKVLFTK
uniref:Uncharacterized protein n=1 Tax=Amphimedon queenslandica TaxID=400682 RepID=A0A1X7V2R4_AMPQE